MSIDAKREIKFRAWDGKEMHLPEYSDKEDFHILPDGSIVETHEHGYERHELTNYRGENWIIMQYTGLKDKNNIDIYEGDKTVDGVIEFNVETCCYIIRRENNTFIRLDVRKDNIEIIGNIHESKNESA